MRGLCGKLLRSTECEGCYDGREALGCRSTDCILKMKAINGLISLINRVKQGSEGNTTLYDIS